MSTSIPDVRVRLTAEGVAEVVSALRSVEAQAGRTAGRSGLGGINTVLGEFKRLLPAIGAATAITGFVGLTRSALKNADAMGKLAEKTGATVEDISALNTAAVLADVSTEQLQGGMARLARSVGTLQAGSKTAVDSFRQINLTAQDFKNLNTGQAFELVAKRVIAIDDSFRRAQVGQEIFGRGFADLVPLLNQVADEGLDTIRARAEELGLLLTGDLAAAADAANDSFDLIKLQAQGLATAFAAGLAPSIVSAMGDIAKSMRGDGVESMQEFGRETGRVLRTVIATFRLFATIVGSIFESLGDRIGSIFAAGQEALKGNLRNAVQILRDADAQAEVRSAKNRERIAEAFENVVQQASNDAPPIEFKAKVDRSALSAEVAAAMAEADRARAGGDSAAKIREREAKRLAEERERNEKRAGAERVEIEQQILELSGRERDLRLSQLDEELTKRRAILELGGGVTETDERNLQRIRTLETARIEFEATSRSLRREFDSLSAQRERIEQDVELGITTELEGQKQIAAIELKRIPVLRELARVALEAARASGDPELIEQAETFSRQIDQVAVSVQKAGDEFLQFREKAEGALTSDLENWLADGIEQAKNLGDAFDALAGSIVQSLQRIAAEIVAQQIIGKLASIASGFFGGGGGLSQIAITATRIASGGLIDAGAPGGVRRFAKGGQVRDNGRNDPFTPSGHRPARFATGGLVGGSTPPGTLAAAVAPTSGAHQRLPVELLPPAARYADGDLIVAPAGAVDAPAPLIVAPAGAPHASPPTASSPGDPGQPGAPGSAGHVLQGAPPLRFAEGGLVDVPSAGPQAGVTPAPQVDEFSTASPTRAATNPQLPGIPAPQRFAEGGLVDGPAVRSSPAPVGGQPGDRLVQVDRFGRLLLPEPGRRPERYAEGGLVEEGGAHGSVRSTWIANSEHLARHLSSHSADERYRSTDERRRATDERYRITDARDRVTRRYATGGLVESDESTQTSRSTLVEHGYDVSRESLERSESLGRRLLRRFAVGGLVETDSASSSVARRSARDSLTVEDELDVQTSRSSRHTRRFAEGGVVDVDVTRGTPAARSPALPGQVSTRSTELVPGGYRRARRYAIGGMVDATQGGIIRGPGSGTSDSIPAITTTGQPLLVSNREFIVRAAIVKQPGVLEYLAQLNRGGFRTRHPDRSKAARFAEGGLIAAAGGAARSAAMRAGAHVGTGPDGATNVTINNHHHYNGPPGSVTRSTEQQVASAAYRGSRRAFERTRG